MKEFLLTYWKDILEIILFISSFLFFLLLKHKNNPALEGLLLELPSIIKGVEDKFGSGNGSVKKDAVLEICDSLFFKLSGVHLKQGSYYAKVVSSQIEKILSAPTRKE